MKIWKILSVIALIGVAMLLSLGCSKSSATTTSTSKTAIVQTGNLSLSITGTGNLAYSKTAKMAFEMAGYIEEVLVSAGDTVKKGDEIARLNTSDWENKIKSLTKTLTTTQRALASAQEAVIKAQRSITTAQTQVANAQRNVVTAQAEVAKAQRAVADKELAVQQSQLDQQIDQYNLSEMEEVKTAQVKVDDAVSNLQIAKSNFKSAGLMGDGDESSYWSKQIAVLEGQLEKAQANLQKVLQGSDVTLTTDAKLQVTQYQLKITQGQRDIEAAQIAVEDAKTAVTSAQLNEAAAQTAVTNAQLDEADAVTAVTNAQLDEAEAEQVVKDAQASLDEIKSLSPVVKAPFDGFITKVNISGGDEVFKGTVAAVISDPNKFEANILVTENDIFSVKLEGDATVSLDALSDMTYPAKITRISPTATVSSGVVNYSVTVELTPTTTKTVTLKDGLSATVKIISEQANNVLIIPSKAITTQGPQSTVQVINGAATDTRVVKVGMTEGTNSEISSGLSAGEKVTYKVSSSASSTVNKSQQGMAIGIGGGPPPGGY